MTAMPGKSALRLGQRRIVELPTKSTALDGGGFVLSAASNAAISLANRAVVAGAGVWTGDVILEVEHPTLATSATSIHNRNCPSLLRYPESACLMVSKYGIFNVHEPLT